VIRRFFERQLSSSQQPAAAPCVPAGVRVYAIGDVHGRVDLLDQLHDLIEADMARDQPQSAHVIYLGDYVDRGPDSAGVLDRLSGPEPQGLRRSLLKGNHEDMLLQVLTNQAAPSQWRRLGGQETMLSYRIDIHAALAEGAADLAGLLSAAMPPGHREMLDRLEHFTVLGDYFFCHAGIRPGIALDRQAPHDLMWIRHEFLDSRANHGRVIVHGHSPVDQVDIRSNRINIDTGAFATGRLSCLVLENTQRRVIST
jgi:serine/threonine protein phosphatase 1